MNNDQLMSLLRTLLQIAGTSVVAHGILGINGAMWERISGGVLMLAPVIWSMYAHTDTAHLAIVAAMPGPAKEAAFAGIPDTAKLAAVEAMPDVAKIIPIVGASDGVAAALNDPSRPKVTMQ